jgi:hypothetical protein
MDRCASVVGVCDLHRNNTRQIIAPVGDTPLNFRAHTPRTDGQV